MQRLLDINAVPPCDNLERYFRYTDPDTGYTTAERDHFSWIDKAKLHRRSNGLGIPLDFEAQMEHQLCEQLPPGWCQRAPDEGWVNARFNWADIANGMRAFAGLIKGGFSFVSQAEADRRSKICATCYFNQPVPGCSTCRKLTEFVSGDIANRHTPWDERLQACAICHCSNRVQIHFPIEALDTADTPDRQKLFPGFCWKKKEAKIMSQDLLRTRFKIEIAFDDDGQMYHANVYSPTDNKMVPLKRTSLRKLLFAINKLVREKNSEVKHFPIPEESLIIAPGLKGDISVIIPARN